MAGFLYFVEGCTRSVERRDLVDWGLTHAFPAVPFNAAIYSKTPSGFPGVLLADLSRLNPYQPRYLPDEQIWTQVLGGNWWVGYYNEARPTPFNLARDRLVDGYLIELVDGMRWQVPLIRRFIDGETFGSCLPRYRTMAYSDRGLSRWIDGEILDEYMPVWQLVDTFWRNWRGALVQAVKEKQDNFAIQLDTPERDAAAILGVNYVVGEFELSALKVFSNDDQKAASEVLRLAADCEAAFDWLTYQDKGRGSSDA